VNSRKAAIQNYKERKLARGIFAVRCQATGSVWVDSAMDLDAAKNRVWFCLRHVDPQMEPSIFAEYNAHGVEAFSYQVLEKLDDDLVALAVRDSLKARKLHWKEQLNARTLWPV